MGSKSREVRKSQVEMTEKQLETRLAILAERGAEGKTLDRDKIVRHLRADLVKAKKRIVAIDTKEELVKTLGEKKAAKAAAPRLTALAKRKKKVAPEDAKGGKKKVKKEKKAKKEKK